MLLRNLTSVKENNKLHLSISGRLIDKIYSAEENPASAAKEIIFQNAIVFPGLINSHDHLDFNNFPNLGNRIYTNYTEWGKDIHANNKPQINEILAIPKDLRLQWGVYKNLLNGITTVVNHGEKVDIKNAPISIFQDTHILHSVSFERRWKWRLNKPFLKHFPYTMHIAEGTDALAAGEADEVIKWNIWKREIIAVHGIAMNEKQAEKFKALIWCPSSNFFLNGETAKTGRLKNTTTLLFGTDSTLSADWNLWNHLLLAQNTKQAGDAEIFDMLTTNAARIWNLRNTAEIKESFVADLVIAEKGLHGSALDSFFGLQPDKILMVIHQGKIILFDSNLYPQLSEMVDVKAFSKVHIGNTEKMVYGDLQKLIRDIKKYHPEIKFPVE